MKNKSPVMIKSLFVIVLMLSGGIFMEFTPLKANALTKSDNSNILNLNSDDDGGFLSTPFGNTMDYGDDLTYQSYSDSMVTSSKNNTNLEDSSSSYPYDSSAAIDHLKNDFPVYSGPMNAESITKSLPLNVDKVIDGFSDKLSSSELSSVGKFIPNQYIVVLDENEDNNPSDILSKVASKIDLGDTKILQVYKHALKGFAIWVPNEKIIEMLKDIPGIDHIEKDVVVQSFAQSLPTGINRVDADLSSAKSGDGTGAVNVDIAILDTGIDLTHSDLNVYVQKSFVTNWWNSFFGTPSANDDNGHGTHVAGIAASKDNSIGTVGVAPGARLWAIKVLDSNGSGALSTIIKGIDYVTQYANQIDVANMSLGCECKSSAFDTAINNSVKAGVTYVVAAGNSAKDATNTQPANNPNVIAVSAIADSDGKCGGVGPSTSYGNDDTLASFSNYGSVVDMASPGVKILSTYKGNSYATMSGTSMASPHVAGAAALYKSTHPSASPSEVLSALKSSGSTPSTSCDGNGHGYFSGDKDNYREPMLYVKNY